MTRADQGAAPMEWPSAAVRERCRRRRIIGIDMWAESSLGVQRVIALAQASATHTEFRLIGAVDEVDDRVRLRFRARDDEVHLTDRALIDLMTRLSDQLRWSGLSKLEEFDGVPAFAPLELS
jgi:hypothetical protein